MQIYELPHNLRVGIDFTDAILCNHVVMTGMLLMVNLMAAVV